MNHLRNIVSEMAHFMCFPFRVLFSDGLVEKIGMRTLETERIRFCKRFLKGVVLDVGCGVKNRLINEYGSGVGIDVNFWPSIHVHCDTENMPFKNASFDTVVLLASLNYVPNKQKVLREIKRVLKKDGIVLVTMINPFIGFVHHRIFRLWNLKLQREIGQVEYGLWGKQVKELFNQAGIEYTKRIPFLYGLNTLHLGSVE